MVGRERHVRAYSRVESGRGRTVRERWRGRGRKTMLGCGLAQRVGLVRRTLSARQAAQHITRMDKVARKAMASLLYFLG